MTTMLNPLTKLNNQYFDVVNKQVNGMAKALHPNEEAKDLIVQQIANQALIPLHILKQPQPKRLSWPTLHHGEMCVMGRNQDPDDMV